MSSNVYSTFVWKIDNVSRSPDMGRVSPTFTPVRGLELNLELIFEEEVFASKMNVAISCSKKPKGIKEIHGKITCMSSESKQCQMEENTFQLLQKEKNCSMEVFCSSTLTLPDEIVKVLNLPNDVIILEVVLAISGQGLVDVAPTSALDTCKELTANYGKMYRSRSNADIKFTFSGGRALPAHRLILSAQSPVFSRMFETDMLEKNSDTVPIIDFDGVVFDLFLAFLYSGELPDDVGFGSLCSLYSAADKYDVSILGRLCSIRMCSLMTADNVDTVLQLSNRHGDSETRRAAINFIHKNL